MGWIGSEESGESLLSMLDSKGKVSKPRLFWEPREIFVRRGEVGHE